MLRKCLLIGGPLDGQWLETHGEDAMYAIELKPFTSEQEFGERSQVQTVHRYKRLDWSVDKKTRFIYVLDSMSPDDFLDTLLEGYKSCQ